MRSKVVVVASGVITAMGFMLVLAAAGSMVARIRITDMLLKVWWVIPLFFLAVNITLYGIYAKSFELLCGRKDEYAPVKYLLVTIAAVAESWVVLILRYLITCLLAVDNRHISLAAGGCAAACGFILLAFILLLLGSAAYGYSWETVCRNTEAAPVYLVAIGLFIEGMNIAVWCVWFALS